MISDKEGVEVLSGMDDFVDSRTLFVAPTDTLKDPAMRQNAQLLSAIFNITNDQCQKLEGFDSTESFMVC